MEQPLRCVLLLILLTRILRDCPHHRGDMETQENSIGTFNAPRTSGHTAGDDYGRDQTK